MAVSIASFVGWRGWCSLALLSLMTVAVGAQDSLSYPPLSEVIRIGAPRLVVGEEQRDSPALFGTIRGVAVDGQGDIYVLDASDQTVRRFGRSGEHIVTAGRSGRGPGDLADPYWLWHDGEHSLYVVDWINGINVFDTRGGQVAFRQRFAEGRRTMAVCKLGGRLIGAGFHDGHILHVMSATGEVIRSFGAAFHPDTDAVVLKVGNSGPVALACDDALGRLYVSLGGHGHVRAYDAAGQLLWDTALPGFHGSRTFRDRTGAVVTLFPKHVTEAIRPVGRDYIVVQAHHKERRSQPGSVRAGRPRASEVDFGILTYVLSAKDGKVITRQYRGPFLMASAGGLVVGYDDDPFPQVFALQVSAPGR